MPIIGFGGGFGGGGTSYINGVVPTSADLPTTVGNPPTDSVYLAKVGSGVWLINRKPAGLYVRVADNGNLNDWTYLGAFPEVNADGNWELYNTADPTKELKFSLSGITTGTVRTLTAPNASGRIQIEGQAIGDTTPAAGTFTTLRINSTSTLEAGIGRPNLGVMGFNRQDAPSTYHFAHGFDGTNRAAFCSDVTFFGWASGNATSVSSCDIRLFRDAAGTLGQRNTTNAQTFNIYNTFTSSTNHERLRLAWASNVAIIGTEKGSGGGTARALEFQTDGATGLSISTGGNVRIGPTSGSSTALLGWNNNCFMRPVSSTTGILTLLNNALDGFNRLNFGGTTSSFPALKRDSATLQVRLADDSAFGALSCGALTLNGNLDASTRNLVTDTTTGTKIGTGTTQKLGFFGATPVDRPETVSKPDPFQESGTVDADARTAVNAVIDRLQELGLIAT
jgi:hypothetical protein